MSGRAKRKNRVAVRTEPIVDATPERLAKGDESEWVNPAEIDSSEQPIGNVRRFRKSHLDRLYRRLADGSDDPRSPLSYLQWHAGNWYREQHVRCHFALSVIASYGERTSAGEISYGLPRSEAQARARQMFMAARRQFPRDMVGFMDRLLIHDELPTYRGRQQMKRLDAIRDALDSLALWLDLPSNGIAIARKRAASTRYGHRAGARSAA